MGSTPDFVFTLFANVYLFGTESSQSFSFFNTIVCDSVFSRLCFSYSLVRNVLSYDCVRLRANEVGVRVQNGAIVEGTSPFIYVKSPFFLLFFFLRFSQGMYFSFSDVARFFIYIHAVTIGELWLVPAKSFPYIVVIGWIGSTKKSGYQTIKN